MTAEDAVVGWWEAAVVVAATTANQTILDIDLSAFVTLSGDGSKRGFMFLFFITPLRGSPIEVDVHSIYAVSAYNGQDSGFASGWQLQQAAIAAATDAFVDFLMVGNVLRCRIDGGTIAMPVIVTARGSVIEGTA